MIWNTLSCVFVFLSVLLSATGEILSSRLCFIGSMIECTPSNIHCKQNEFIIITHVETRNAIHNAQCSKKHGCSKWDSVYGFKYGDDFKKFIFTECIRYAPDGSCVVSNNFLPVNDPTSKWYADVQYACVEKESSYRLCSNSTVNTVQNAAHLNYLNNGSIVQDCYCDVSGASLLQLTAIVMDDCIGGICNVECNITVGNDSFLCPNDDVIHFKNISVISPTTRISLRIHTGHNHLLIWVRAAGPLMDISCSDSFPPESETTFSTSLQTTTGLTSTSRPATTQIPETSSGIATDIITSTQSSSSTSASSVLQDTTISEGTTQTSQQVESAGAGSIGPIVGGSFGAIVILVTILVIALVWYRKRHTDKRNPSSEIEQRSGKDKHRSTHINKAYDFMSDVSSVTIHGISTLSAKQNIPPEMTSDYAECEVGVEYAHVNNNPTPLIKPDDGYSFAKPTEDEPLVVEPNAAGYSYAQVNVNSPNKKSPKRADSYSHVDLNRSYLDSIKPGNGHGDQYSHIGKNRKENAGCSKENTGITFSDANTYSHIAGDEFDSTSDHCKPSQNSDTGNEYSHIGKSLHANRATNRTGDLETVDNYSHVELSGTKMKETMIPTENVYSHMNSQTTYPKTVNTTPTTQSGISTTIQDNDYSHIDHKTKYPQRKGATDNDYAHVTKGLPEDKQMRIHDNGEHKGYYNTVACSDGNYGYLERL